MLNRPITGGVGLPPYGALADAVRLLAGTENMGRTEAAAADGRLREALAAALARTDADFRLKLRVAPVRQGPAGVLAYLLHEADRLSGLVRPMPRTPGLSREQEAAWVSLTFLRHTAQEVSRICRRPHLCARLPTASAIRPRHLGSLRTRPRQCGSWWLPSAKPRNGH
ncbi:hypothetical protein ABT126_03290 [Streptomyces sp. NPDC002012]|uniref:hypothetical protein n=1 Tax=Streptomyces sp. NPDC002012 TaxID=3154532 RepID=UPI00331D15FD